MLAEVLGPCRPDFLIYANRLFNPQRVFEGDQRRRLRWPRSQRPKFTPAEPDAQGQSRGEICREPLEISATGDVSSGRIAVEYALRGCASFQIHTLFQLPAEAFAMPGDPRSSAPSTGCTSTPATDS